MDHITAIAWIRNIKHVAANGDYEGAHSLEDDLFEMETELMNSKTNVEPKDVEIPEESKIISDKNQANKGSSIYND